MKALIVSVGGSPAPVVKSLQVHSPDFVCFLTSQACVDLIPAIIKEEAGVKPCDHHGPKAARFMPLLRAGEMTYVRKDATLGMGGYRPT